MRICTQTELENLPQLDWSFVAPLLQADARSAIERASSHCIAMSASRWRIT
jgi:hypothetical protein